MVLGAVRRNWNKDIKNKAIELRKQGLSLGEIKSELNVSKSTLFSWIRETNSPDKQQRQNWMEKARKMGVVKLRKKKADRLQKYEDEVLREVDTVVISNDLRKSVLAMLYWAEGAKTVTTMQFSNTDPNLMKIFITLLRQCYVIDERRLRVQLFLHYYHRRRKVKKFWSDLLNIPESQFTKIAHKPRSRGKRYRKNLGGICALRYNSLELKEKITRFGYKLGDRLV